jgi:hypothetical protein
LSKPNHLLSRHLSAEQIEVRIWAFVVVMITLILTFIVIALLYSVTFVTQPIKAMAPIDQAYTKMLNDIVLLIVGGIGGIVGKRAIGAAAQAVAGGTPPTPPAPVVTSPAPVVPPPAPVAASVMPNFNWMGFTNPALDESWTPGPPPTTPPDHMEDDYEREVLAAARQESKA